MSKEKAVSRNICSLVSAPVLCRPDTPPDTRALWLHRLTCAPVSRLVHLVHGSLIPLHGVLEEAAAGATIGQGPDIGETCVPLIKQTPWKPLGDARCSAGQVKGTQQILRHT